MREALHRRLAVLLRAVADVQAKRSFRDHAVAFQRRCTLSSAAYRLARRKRRDSQRAVLQILIE
ncbi:hypothetical protein M5X00_14230, partial [Paenibacillus alvei]|uniref:hypothetical protein n=1 Tax=Paenibacillus alvei TaxID=44250 RepID=UPI002282CCCE